MKAARSGLFAAGLVLALVAVQAAARPGGGNSYSGGSSGGSGGSSRSSGGSSGSSGSSSYSSSSGTYSGGILVKLFVLLMFAIPSIGFVLLVVSEQRAIARRQLNVGGREPSKPLPREPRTDIRDGVREFVGKHDPDFSLVLFEDFAYTLYAESHRARHDPSALLELAPYWTPEQEGALSRRAPAGGRVQAVVVGSLEPERVTEAQGRLHIEYSFVTNLHIQLPPTGNASVSESLDDRVTAATQYVEEFWAFSRDATVKTRPWTGVRKLGCPSCGAPYRSTADARCESCGQDCGGGHFDWQVTSVVVRREETREHSLTGTSDEVGTDAPTRFAPLVKDRRDELFRDDPGVSQAALEARLRLIYETLQPAWTAQDLRPVRPFVSDRLHAYLQYWIDAYKERNLRNLMDRPRFEECVVARVERDAHYDAVTLRIWATGCDYTVGVKTGYVVGGSRSVERRYSEYWTLVRSAKVRGAPKPDKSCPACGAALNINMAGNCEYCSAHVTSGEFDWVLSKIEQDEAYQG